MSQSSRPEKRRARAGLLASVAICAFGAVAAPAYAEITHPKPVAAPQAQDDGLGQDGFYLEADLVTRDDSTNQVTATGAVEVRYRGRILRAGQLVYDRKTGVATATQKVTIVDTSGVVTNADSMVLDQDFRTGVARGFSAQMEDGSTIAADTAVRRSESISELNKAIYTPCKLCAEDGSPNGKPTWSIKAEKVVQDRDRKLVYYKNAVIQVFGVPIFYAPVFWHPDPTASRASGFLQPVFKGSNRRGLSYEQPYALVLSPSEDLVISPQINLKVNPFINLEYRKRFYSGEIDARVGYTYERDFTGDGDRFGDRTNRTYLLAKGAFDITEHWRWGFAAERASEDLIFDKYDVRDVYEQRGLVFSDDRRLTSELYVTRQDNLSWLSINAISVQGLRPTDNDRAFPLIAPLIEARWETPTPILGGRLRLQGSAVALTREQSQFDTLGQDTPGVDSRRASGQLDWRSNVTFSNGLRISPFLQGRVDYYNVADYPGGAKDESFARALGVVGADFSLPFYRRDGNRTIILEPLAQVAISPNVKPDPRIPNEDSLVFEFDETTLFRANKFPGFDLYEGGARLNTGARATVMYDDGRSASLLIGRSFRDRRDLNFPSRSGLQNTSSDWIVAAEITPIKGLNIFTRARFDSDTGNQRRVEAGADVKLDRGWGYVRYLRDNQDITGVQREDLDFSGGFLVTKNWGFTVAGTRDIENDVWRRKELGVLYRDDCLDIAVVWVHEETQNRTLGPSDSVVVRLTLATLGDKGYSQ